MIKTKIFLVELSPKRPDGSRATIKDQVVATCDAPGTAHIIADYLRKGIYKDILSQKDDNKPMFLLTVEARKPFKPSKAI